MLKELLATFNCWRLGCDIERLSYQFINPSTAIATDQCRRCGAKAQVKYVHCVAVDWASNYKGWE